MASEDPELSDVLAGVEALYTTNLAEHGTSSASVGWPDPDAQRLRFDKLAYVIDTDAPITVNDWGCGYGAMFRYLDERFTLGGYTGYDISAEMLDAARGYVPDPRARWVKGAEVTETADYSFVSGTFNVRMDASEAAWQRYVENTLRALAARSRRGFAFNLLTTYVDWRKDDLFYADPRHFFAFCREHISRYVTLLHDYPLYEWTIAVRFEPPESA
jgi:cyclopropane fatty-acyl-phospholipid synthase-like methyltransferase